MPDKKTLDDFFGLPPKIDVDASAFEVLLRGASAEEVRLVRRLLSEWSRGDENSFPHQLALLTLSQWRAAARVPVETAKVLQQHQNTAQDAARAIAQAADAKLAEFAQLGKLAGDLSNYVQKLIVAGDAALDRLKQTTSAYHQAEERARQAARSNDLLVLCFAFLIVAIMAFLLGGVTCRYMFLRGWVH